MFRLYNFTVCVRGQYLHLTIMPVAWYDLDCPSDRNVRRKILLWHSIGSIVMEKCVSVGSWVKVEVESKVHPRTVPEVPEGCRGNL
jgi:hypothetical protein